MPPISVAKLFNTAIENSGGVLALNSQKDLLPPESGSALCYMDPEDTGNSVVLDSDKEPAPADPTHSLEDDAGTHWHLGGALNVSGVKHLFSNISVDVLKRREEFPHFQEALSAVNTMHHQTFYRDRIQQIMIPPMDKLYKYYEGGNLIMWRWSSLVDVCEALHRREGALKQCWSLPRFLSVGQSGSGSLPEQYW